ncbi:glycosyltransferase family 4 protein [Lewinella sp. 4G2]|uniref:glycosyltransferase family 4 protein n=1 Tax=Lewinella sp. 4G2 TaxID=1803372 RepID=UPI0007B4E578|nr:glycosyltransferase family 4 protein [Lewinella sp. 4G2]OAV43078.1 hypothetical protein A3850_000540 [Lewinella sp. 4G2]
MHQQFSILLVSDQANSLRTTSPLGRMCLSLVQNYGQQVTVLTELGNDEDWPEIEGLRRVGNSTKKHDQKQLVGAISAELKGGDYDLLHLIGRGVFAAGIKAAKGWPGKVITHFNGEPATRWWTGRAYFEHLHPRVDAIFSHRHEQIRLISAAPFSSRSQTSVVAFGHDPSWYENVTASNLEGTYGIPDDRITVLIRASGSEGLDYLGEAIRRLPADLGLHFLILGKGLQTPEFESFLTDSYYAHQYTFVEEVDNEVALLSAVDAVVFPHLNARASLQPLYAALFAGLPVLHVGGPMQQLNEDLILIVPPKDEDALRDALQSLAESPALRNRLGDAAGQFARDYLNAEKTTGRLLDAYTVLVKGPGHTLYR